MQRSVKQQYLSAVYAHKVIQPRRQAEVLGFIGKQGMCEVQRR